MFQRLSVKHQRLWKIAATVVGVGTTIKFGYFWLSREIIIKSLEENDKQARSYLKESQNFGNWAAEDRQKRLKKLTPEQREQMQQYLIMMAESNKEVFPHGESQQMKTNANRF